MAIGNVLWVYDLTFTATDAAGAFGINTVNGAPNGNRKVYVRVHSDWTDAQQLQIVTAHHNRHFQSMKAATGEWLGVTACTMSNAHKTTLAERDALRAAGYKVREWTGTDHEYD